MAALTLASALVSLPTTVSASPSPLGLGFERGFAAPPLDARPKTRYWWPCAEIDPNSIDAEIKQIADRGFGSVEIQCMLAFDPVKNGWGSASLTDRMERAAQAGRKYGIDIDFTVGPSWPLVVPGLTPDSPEAAQELAYGRSVVAGGTAYSGPVPAAPAPTAGVTKQKLVAVLAVECAGSCTMAKPVKLKRDSLVDLTGTVRDASLSWTAPNGGEWLLLGYWQRGTGQASVSRQSVSGSPSYVVDHFSTRGATAATRYWDDHVLSPRLRDLVKRTGGDLFEDSLELDANLHWTSGLLDRFQDLRGYSLRENLPVLSIDRIHRQYTSATPADTPDFEFDDGSGARIRDDYYRTLTDLYIGEHVGPLKKWANALGLRYRAQPYGTTIDTARIDLSVDVPETESLGAQDDYSEEPFFWTAGGAVHLSGKKLFSLECCAVYNSAYAQTWPQMLRHFNTAFTHGVNQIVLHGVAAGHVPGMAWPGFSPFTMQGGNGFSEAWGPRQPTWDDTGKITGWVSRMQYLLRQGRPSVDLAVYRQSYGRDVRIQDGAKGFTLDYVGPTDLAQVSVRDGRLAPDGPAYRALILDHQPTMQVETARKLLEFTQRGLPIIIVGEPPARTPGANRAAAQDAELGRIMRLLLARPSVRRIAGQNELAPALAGLKVRAAAESSVPGLVTVRRARTGGDLYYVYNPTASPVSTSLSLEGAGSPYKLDAWTGKISPVGQYQAARSRTVVPVGLAPGQSTVLALGRDISRHATATTGGEIVSDGKGIRLRSSTAGSYTVTLDNGRPVQVDVPSVGVPQELAEWKLTVDDWRQGPAGDRETVRHELGLHGLKPWKELPGLADVSGTGVYTTTATLSDLDGAYLDLGDVIDTFQVTVNGRVLPAPDQVVRRLDLTGYVRPGSNTITVRVATPLRNRLRVTPGFPLQAEQPRQSYGLLGPVKIIPYREVPIQE
ncbi:glycosyl hydrolase [Actinomadura rudentiformis]|uniref:glycosyl hydrolase n=1 Tax=Actinomadura rudentiformis TaxID=359158 RepID=UPI001CEF66BA|nr:glycosyl hydrolase [Actinomadura rudentiformis]